MTLAPQLEIPTVNRGGFTPCSFLARYPTLGSDPFPTPPFFFPTLHFDRLGRKKPLGWIDVNATSEREKRRVFSAVKPRTPLTRARLWPANVVFRYGSFCHGSAPFSDR